MKLCILITILLFGCVNQSNKPKSPVASSVSSDSIIKETKAVLKKAREMDSLINDKQLTSDNAPTKYELETFNKMRPITSYAKFLRYYFTLGSSKRQVIKVQGYPDDIVSTKNNTEVLFYNQCEITLSNDRVINVTTPSDCLKYIDYKTCLHSSDAVVEKNITMIMYEMSVSNQ